jgi:chlorobactene glucosyltransferase
MDLFLLYQYIVAAILLVVMINFIINNLLFKNTANYRIPESFLEKNPLVSILIPARNEEKNIGRCLNSLIRQDYANIEILVLDDNSNDRTLHIVQRFCKKDSRIRLYHGKPLAKGWLGKSYACQQLSEYARGEFLLFVDADTLHFGDSVSSSLACLIKFRLDALSVFAKQIMVTIHERMMVPAGNFMIMGFLPLSLIRKTRSPLFCTAIGQFMLFKKDVYQAIGGHGSVKSEILEDVLIAKQVKRCGYRFMIFDGRNNLYCRMYHNFREVVQGYTKVLFSAFDYRLAMISIAFISVAAIHLAPFIMLSLALLFSWPQAVTNVIFLQVIMVMLTKIILAIRFRMRAIDVILHPLSVIYLLSIAVNSVFQYRYNIGVCWKGRTYNVSGKKGNEEELKLVNDSSK